MLPGKYHSLASIVVFAGSMSEITSEKILNVFAVSKPVVLTAAIAKFNSDGKNPTAAILSAS